MNDTIILRFADHGEGGLAHGMREKAYTVYEEMIHIPLIVHNPKLYPEPLETTAFYDHLNLLPTILDLAGVPDPESYAIGKSIVPIILDPSKAVQDHTIFSFDDRFFVPASAAGGHIRRSAKATGPMRCTSASTAPALSTSFTISRMTRAK
jgi:choline-sulfatase